jgi:ABC-type lipoprotein release transport system permease subunit
MRPGLGTSHTRGVSLGLALSFTLAWRNLWRNRKRTWTTVSSVFFAVALAIAMRSLQEGSYNHMVHTSVGATTGYIQIHRQGFWQDQTLENTFAADDARLAWPAQDPVANLVPRFESFALAFAGKRLQGVPLTGIDPELEKQLSAPHKKLVAGKYLETDDDGVLVAQGLAEYLGLAVADTLALIGQGYRGASAAGLFVIRGIVRYPNPTLNRSAVLGALATVQSFYSAPDRLTALSCALDEADDYPEALKALRDGADEGFEVMGWEEMQVELKQQIESDKASGIFMIAILYMIVGFGIVGTLLMVLAERRREIGMLLALGQRPGQVAGVIALEILLVGLLGFGLAGAVSLPLLAWGVDHPIRLTGQATEAMVELGIEPIMPWALESGLFIEQLAALGFLLALAALLPVAAVHRTRITQALQR